MGTTAPGEQDLALLLLSSPPRGRPLQLSPPSAPPPPHLCAPTWLADSVLTGPASSPEPAAF